MNERYFAKVVSVQDSLTIVINRGAENNIKIGDKFIVVGLGDVIIDPDTGEELEQLEIVRGNVTVSHIQGKITTLTSCDYTKSDDTKEITKVIARGALAILGPTDTTTESIKPGTMRIKPLNSVQVGDFVIKKNA